MNLTNLTNQLKLKTDFNIDNDFGVNDLNGITGIIDNSVSSLQALIFSNKSPENEDRNPIRFDETGITSGYDKMCFVFDLKKDYKLNLSSEITDHYVENNIAIQDHVGLKPIIIEVSGSIAEVNLKELLGKKTDLDNYLGENGDGNLFNSIDSYLSRMGSLTSFAPNLVNQSLSIYNSAKYAYATTNKVINFNKKDSLGKYRFAYNSVYDEDIIKETKQFKWIDWFKTQWWNRASFSIVTPYGVFNNMYIMDLSAVQPDSTRYVTNLNIKFKQIRRATVLKTRKKLAQKMETQSSKTESVKYDYTTDLQKITKKAIQDTLAKPIENTGDVTQVTQQEYNKYEAMVKTLNVPSSQGAVTPPNILLNAAIRGVATPPPVAGVIL